MNWAELAKHLNTSRIALGTWRKMEGAPAEPDVDAWESFVAERGLGRTSSQNLTELRAEVEREKVRKLRRENEVAEGRIVRVDAVAEMLTDLAAKLDLLITQKVETELPPKCVGQSIAEIRAQCRATHDEIREVARRGLLKWKPGE